MGLGLAGGGVQGSLVAVSSSGGLILEGGVFLGELVLLLDKADRLLDLKEAQQGSGVCAVGREYFMFGMRQHESLAMLCYLGCSLYSFTAACW